MTTLGAGYRLPIYHFVNIVAAKTGGRCLSDALSRLLPARLAAGTCPSGALLPVHIRYVTPHIQTLCVSMTCAHDGKQARYK